jgi:hypothetical protein
VLREQVTQNRIMRQTLSRETAVKIARLKKQMQEDKAQAVAEAVRACVSSLSLSCSLQLSSAE